MFARQDNPNMSRDGYTRTRSGYGWDVCRIVGLSSQTLLLKRRRTVKVLAKEPQWLTPWHGLSGDELGRSPPGLQLARRGRVRASMSGRTLLGTPPAHVKPWPIPPQQQSLCCWGGLADLCRYRPNAAKGYPPREPRVGTDSCVSSVPVARIYGRHQNSGLTAYPPTASQAAR